MSKQKVIIKYEDGYFQEFESISEMIEIKWKVLTYLGIADLDKNRQEEEFRVTRLAQKALRDHGKWVLGNGLVTKI